MAPVPLERVLSENTTQPQVPAESSPSKPAPEPGKTEPQQAEPTPAEPTPAEPKQAEPEKVEPAKAEPQPESPAPETSKPANEPAKAEGEAAKPPAAPADESARPEGDAPKPAEPQPQPAAEKPAIKEGDLKLAVETTAIKPTPEELQFVEYCNRERVKRGLNALTVDPLLIAVARKHSAEMRDRNYFNHESPISTNRTPMDRFLLAVTSRPAYACVGENLYWSQVMDVRRGHEAFMNSEKHRENVLFPRFEKIGVGIVRRGSEFWVTQMFLTTTDPNSVAKKPVK